MDRKKELIEETLGVAYASYVARSNEKIQKLETELESLNIKELHTRKQEYTNKINPTVLKLHVRIWNSDIQKDILRVPNGMIYSDYDSEKDILFNSVFVPDGRF